MVDFTVSDNTDHKGTYTVETIGDSFIILELNEEEYRKLKDKVNNPEKQQTKWH